MRQKTQKHVECVKRNLRIISEYLVDNAKLFWCFVILFLKVKKNPKMASEKIIQLRPELMKKKKF